MLQIKNYFSKSEIYLWMLSSFFIIASFCIFDRENYLTLCASLIGVTSLIFNAKGNPIGQILMVIFSIIYGIISYSFCYYGEMITYLGMTMPMSVMAMVSWFLNPFEESRMEVNLNEAIRTSLEALKIVLFFVASFRHTSYCQKLPPRKDTHFQGLEVQ